MSVLLVYHALSGTGGKLSDLIEKVCDKVVPNGSGDDADMDYRDTVYEEDAGDSYEI